MDFFTDDSKDLFTEDALENSITEKRKDGSITIKPKENPINEVGQELQWMMAINFYIKILVQKSLVFILTLAYTILFL